MNILIILGVKLLAFLAQVLHHQLSDLLSVQLMYIIYHQHPIILDQVGSDFLGRGFLVCHKIFTQRSHLALIFCWHFLHWDSCRWLRYEKVKVFILLQRSVVVFCLYFVFVGLINYVLVD